MNPQLTDEPSSQLSNLLLCDHIHYFEGAFFYPRQQCEKEIALHGILQHKLANNQLFFDFHLKFNQNDCFA